MVRSPRTTAAAVFVAVAATGCSTAAHVAAPPPPRPSAAPTATPTPPPPHRSVRARAVPRLVPFASCADLLSTVKQEAMHEVGAYGLPGSGDVGGYLSNGGPVAAAGSTFAGGGTVASSAGTTSAPEAAPASGGFSTTNNQEAGVDEPDIAKTDGKVLVVVRHSPLGLQVIGVDGSTPRKLGFVSLQSTLDDAQLFLSGSLAVAIGMGTNAVVTDGMVRPVTRAVVVDLSDPAAPKVVRSFGIPGNEVDARFVNGRVVLVMQNQPALPFRGPTSDSTAARAIASFWNKTVVRRSTVSDWVPPVTTTPSHRTIPASCGSAWHSSGQHGLQTVSVVSLDPGREDSVHQTTILGNASVIYASTRALFVTQPQQFFPTPVDMPVEGAPGAVSAGGMVAEPMRPSSVGSQTTTIHEFDISDAASPRYVASGVVAGDVVDQYSLSEDNGFLRIATNVGIAIPAPGEGEAPKVLSDNRVTVLQPKDGALVQVGQVRGLGRGERLYGVRFLGDLGYVVTFRQIDPLFVLDLADPRHPRQLGSLKVTGFSAYLHPLGNGLMFGLGKHVDSREAPIGEQLSVFDVSSPSHPMLRSRVYVDGADSPAESDHHAFLWWPSDRLLAVPLTSWGAYVRPGTVVYHVTTSGQLDRVGEIRPPQPASAQDYQPGFARTLVIGGVLYSVGDQGVLANRISSLDRVAWLPFA